MIQSGTYVRESDGATLCYHSPTRWNDPVFAVNAMRYDRAGSQGYWRIVRREEVQELRGYLGFDLKPGEYVEVNLDTGNTHGNLASGRG